MARNPLARLLPESGPGLREILDPTRGCVDSPIRAEVFGAERLALHGRSLGLTHQQISARARASSFYPRLRSNIRVLREAHLYLDAKSAAGYDISAAGEWLLDNFHLLESQLQEVHEGLPRSYYRALPVLAQPPLAGLPRIYAVAWAFVAHTDSAFDEDLMRHFLEAYGQTCELKLRELRALPTSLRVVLIENLRRLAERVAANDAAREVANLCCDRAQGSSRADLDELLHTLNRRGVGRAFLAQMANRLSERRPERVESQREWLLGVLPDFTAAQAQLIVDQAADNLSVSNAVTSLRTLDDADWLEIVTHASALFQRMLGAPTFAAEYPATQERTLHEIARLAQRGAISERVVADAVLGLMRAADPSDDLACGARHWLLGAGRPALLGALRLHDPFALAWDALAPRAVGVLYLGSVLLGVLGTVIWLLHHERVLDRGSTPGWLIVLSAGLLVLTVSEAVTALVNRLISESVRPRVLPRLGLVNGIPPEHRVLVAVPAILDGAASVSPLIRRLLLHHLANPELCTQFALLSDWADADTARTDADQAVLDVALQEVRALNLAHPAPADAAPRFIVLHRERRFSVSEQRWIGWERKRGKLELLVAAMAQSGANGFIDLGEASRLAPHTPYLVTLDSDTQLPPGRLRDLVGVAAHPENRPHIDLPGHRVLRGYGILQPRVVTPLPRAGDFTWFHWLFAGQCGIDPYSASSSEVYQDVFGEGTFTGKGLLHVAAVHAVLAGRLPEDLVLSHDLLEGSLARCASLSDVTLMEEGPYRANVAAARVHRWTRGDWQLLPVLLRPWRYRMSWISRWKMVDNLRRSLVAPAAFALVVASLFGAPVPTPAAVALLLGAFAAGPLIGALVGFAPSRSDVAMRHFFHRAVVELVRAACAGVWHLTQSMHEAWMALDAIGRALYRMVVSKRHLLQWATAASVQAAAPGALGALLRASGRELVAAALLFAVIVVASTPERSAGLALCALWLSAPVCAWWCSRARPADVAARLSAVQRHHLEGVARDTWRYFERCVSAEDLHLPPDNLQIVPHETVAHRTSPTNIGLYLLSVACAREFGWIDTAQLIGRLEATLGTLLTLQRYRGHFLNWYDTRTGTPLLPLYVSTVDSGNLGAHLLAVAQACEELARAASCAGAAAGPGDDLARLTALSTALRTLAWQAEYRFLYHPRRRLFHIGWRIAESALDTSMYDLLASESRLASLIAIAKGDVGVSHWAALGRPFFGAGTIAGLRSWSGSMFEYLMPGLVVDEPRGSVLRQACEACVSEQIRFAVTHQVPWGTSESAYAGRDHTLAYQYAPHGVPRLALRRTPADELVVAPYATALAAQIAPRRSLSNFEALETLSARGAFGFIEAVDFSPLRRSTEDVGTAVGTFMAHHQGMSLVALTNLLRDGAAQRWGMADPHIEAVGSLLHERSPQEVSVLAPTPRGPVAGKRRHPPGLPLQSFPGQAALEPTQLLSNGHYSVALRPNGAGWSRLGRCNITRARDDALRDADGSFFYLRWDQQPRPVSLTQHPAPDPAAHYRCGFHADRVCLDAEWAELHTCITVWVSPEDDVEFRKVEIRNVSSRSIDVELMSAFEVTLTDARADAAHPAFSNLFVRALWRPADQALVCERKSRHSDEAGLSAAHFLANSDDALIGIQVLADRASWLGRNHAAGLPLARFAPALVGAADAVRDLDTGLDPVCAMAARVRVAPGTSACLVFATAAAADPDVLSAVIDKYRQVNHVQRAAMMSNTLSGIRLRALGIGPQSLAAIQSLTTALVLNLTRRGAAVERAELDASDACDRRLLWRLGISGDRPILLASVSAAQDLMLLRTLARALKLWAWSGVACDLVVVNSEPTSYLMPLQQEARALCDGHTTEGQDRGTANTTSLVVLSDGDVSGDEMATLRRVARLHLVADGRPLRHHVEEWMMHFEAALALRHDTSVTALHCGVDDAVDAPFRGAFEPDSGEFRFAVDANARPARPWVNVLANPEFGAHLSEAGGGYTWAVNSRLNQITGWTNDPVADPASEWFVLQDVASRKTWNVCASSWGDEPLVYRVAHGQGHSRIEHRCGAADVTATWCVDPNSSVKQIQLEVVNRGRSTLELRLIGVVEWIMGAGRDDRFSVHTDLYRQRLSASPGRESPAYAASGQKLTALLCTQPECSAGFGQGTAFFGVAGPAEEVEDWTCDRRECFDARGHTVVPDHFGQRRGSGLDPCAALSVRLSVAPGSSAQRVFLLGYAETVDAARRLAVRSAATPASQRLDEARRLWDQLLGTTQVHTPDPLFDAMVNRWLLYQTVACRLWAKSGFYQAGGATGFRDQLQDALALTWAAPDMLRRQIVLCASRQFIEGDVQHWWHTPGGAGVRTHFSDDLLWLPYACVRYVHATGDLTLLDEVTPFLVGHPVPPDAEDLYETPTVGATVASVYEHAARTVDRSLRVGVHGLPLMGGGDWNDGMNLVGVAGRGESVWLGWFLCGLVAGFAPLARARGDGERAARWEAAAIGWKAALAGPAWDGRWFRRAFFDDGSALGSAANPEARIDLIAQAWSVLANAAPLPMQRLALASVESELLDRQACLIRLLDPPLAKALPDAGYIQAYPPGVRENGGQYSHAGVWALMAQARAAVAWPDDGSGTGRAHAADLVYRDFTWLSPAHRAADPSHGALYQIEPYVMAGDVYSQPPWTGRGGWSWYTGSSAWLHRAAIESIFGLDLRASTLTITPCLPSAWPRAEITLQRAGRSMRFILLRDTVQAARQLSDELGARLLESGVSLDWSLLTGACSFVLAVP